MSQTGNRFFRSSFISYVHYKENGEIAPIRVDGTGVGQYDANNGSIEAEDYFKASQIYKMENREGCQMRLEFDPPSLSGFLFRIVGLLHQEEEYLHLRSAYTH